VLPRYGSEHLLVFRERESGAATLGLLLAWDDGSRLEREATAGPSGGGTGLFAGAALGAALLGRGRFFDVVDVAGSRRAAWQPGDDLTAVLLRSLAAAGLHPLSVRLSRPANVAVRYMDMGANTPAAPAGVALAPALATLLCRDAAGGERGVPLEGAGEAVALALRCEIEVRVAAALWAQHAVPSREALPEVRPDAEVPLAVWSEAGRGATRAGKKR